MPTQSEFRDKSQTQGCQSAFVQLKDTFYQIIQNNNSKAIQYGKQVQNSPQTQASNKDEWNEIQDIMNELKSLADQDNSSQDTKLHKNSTEKPKLEFKADDEEMDRNLCMRNLKESFKQVLGMMIDEVWDNEDTRSNTQEEMDYSQQEQEPETKFDINELQIVEDQYQMDEVNELQSNQDTLNNELELDEDLFNHPDEKTENNQIVYQIPNVPSPSANDKVFEKLIRESFSQINELSRLRKSSISYPAQDLLRDSEIQQAGKHSRYNSHLHKRLNNHVSPRRLQEGAIDDNAQKESPFQEYNNNNYKSEMDLVKLKRKTEEQLDLIKKTQHLTRIRCLDESSSEEDSLSVHPSSPESTPTPEQIREKLQCFNDKLQQLKLKPLAMTDDDNHKMNTMSSENEQNDNELQLRKIHTMNEVVPKDSKLENIESDVQFENSPELRPGDNLQSDEEVQSPEQIVQNSSPADDTGDNEEFDFGGFCMDDIIKANDKTLMRYDFANNAECGEIDIIDDDGEFEEAKEQPIENDLDFETRFQHFNLQSPKMIEQQFDDPISKQKTHPTICIDDEDASEDAREDAEREKLRTIKEEPEYLEQENSVEYSRHESSHMFLTCQDNKSSLLSTMPLPDAQEEQKINQINGFGKTAPRLDEDGSRSTRSKKGKKPNTDMMDALSDKIKRKQQELQVSHSRRAEDGQTTDKDTLTHSIYQVQNEESDNFSMHQNSCIQSEASAHETRICLSPRRIFTQKRNHNRNKTEDEDLPSPIVRLNDLKPINLIAPEMDEIQSSYTENNDKQQQQAHKQKTCGRVSRRKQRELRKQITK